MTPEIKSTIIEVLETVLNPFGAKYDFDFKKEGDQWRVNINSEVSIDQELIFIKALQHLTRVYVHNKFPEDRTHFIVDLNYIKKQREKKIKISISNLAKEKVLKDGKTVIIVGLSGYERMIIHKILSEARGLNTSSIGDSKDRKLILMPTSEFGATGMDEAIIINIDKF